MASTTYSTQEANSTGHLSQSWAYLGRRIPIVIEDPSTANLIAGAGGVLTNAVDMVRPSSPNTSSHLLTNTVQSKWAATILNGGVDPATNNTIIPSSAFAETTTARMIQAGNVTKDKGVSIIGYGLGWQRNSFMGHDVSFTTSSKSLLTRSHRLYPSDNHPRWQHSWVHCIAHGPPK